MRCQLSLVVVFYLFLSFTVSAQTDTLGSSDMRFDTFAVESAYVASRRTSFPLRNATVLAETFNRGNIFDPVELLAGRVNGLLVSKPGHNVNGRAVARLRGVSSLYAGEGPLSVVDGFVGLDPRFLDPHDIVEIEAKSTGQGAAAYGLRGGGGVLHYRTRSLFNEYEPGLHYHGGVAVSSVANAPEVLDAAGHRAAIRSVAESNGQNADQLISRVNYGGETDWLNAVTRSGLSHSHYLSYAGKPWRNAVYRLSSGYRNVQGIGAMHDGFAQLTGRLQLEQKLLGDKLNIWANLGYFDYRGHVLPADVIRYALSFNPSAPKRVTDPGFTVPEPLRQRALANYGEFFEEEAFAYNNPVAILEQFRQQQEENALLTQFATSYTPFTRLTLRAAYHRSASDYQFSSLAQRTSRYRGGAGEPGDIRGFVSRDTRDVTNQQFTLNGNLELFERNDYSLILTLGYFHQRFDREERTISGNGFPQESVSLSDVPDLLEEVASSPFYQNNGLLATEKITAFYGGLHYDHDNLFQLSGSARYEGSSRNGPSARYGLYGALHGSVNLSDWLLVGPANSLFLRAGFESAGQQPFGVADHQPRRRQIFEFSQAPDQGGFVLVNQFVNAANPNLAPERVNTINLGVDFIPVGDVPLRAQVDYYRRTTTNLLIPDLPLYNSSAFVLPPQAANVTDLELRSSGIELSASYLFGFSETRRYNRLTFQLATYSADLVSVASTEGYRWGTEEQRLFRGGTFGVGGCCSSLTYLIPGQEVGVFQAPVLDVEASRSAGQAVLLDDGQPAIVGGGLPNLSINLINEFRRDRFSLSVVFSGVFGHEIVNFRNALLGNDASLLFRPIDNLLINETTLRGLGVPNTSFTDYHVESGNYFALSNLQLGFQLMAPDTQRKTKAEVYLAGQNLLLLTQYSGNDPSVRFFNDFDQNGRIDIRERDPAPGVDSPNSYLRAATLMLGFRLGL